MLFVPSRKFAGRIQWGENKPFAPRENDWELAFPCNKARAQPWTQKRRGPPLAVCQMFFRAQENACNCQGSGNNNEAFQYKWCVGTCLCPGPPSPLLYSFAALHWQRDLSWFLNNLHWNLLLIVLGHQNEALKQSQVWNEWLVTSDTVQESPRPLTNCYERNYPESSRSFCVDSLKIHIHNCSINYWNKWFWCRWLEHSPPCSQVLEKC